MHIFFVVFSEDSRQPVKLPCMPGGKHSPPLPPKKVMICVPPGLDSPNPLSTYPPKCGPPKGVPPHLSNLLPSHLAGLSSLHQSHGHPLQLQYGSLHAPSRIIEELNKTLALSLQRFERLVATRVWIIISNFAEFRWIMDPSTSVDFSWIIMKPKSVKYHKYYVKAGFFASFILN